MAFMELTVRPGVALALLGLLAFGAHSLIRGGQAKSGKAGRMETHDDLLVRVEKSAPGFGGMFMGKDGRLVVYLLDPDRLDDARAAIVQVFGASQVPAAGVRAQKGRYTVSQLRRWADRASRLLEIPGVTMVDLDEARNRVAVAIDDPVRTSAVEKALEPLAIPRGAVVLDVKGPIRQMDRARP